jgi:hypothetical protein
LLGFSFGNPQLFHRTFASSPVMTDLVLSFPVDSGPLLVQALSLILVFAIFFQA